MALVTLDQSLTHLRLPEGATEYYSDLYLKAEQATAIVIEYLKRPELLDDSPAWTDQTDPSTDREFAIVQACVLDVLANLWQHRGDDGATDGPLTNRIRAILSLHRDPTLA